MKKNRAIIKPFNSRSERALAEPHGRYDGHELKGFGLTQNFTRIYAAASTPSIFAKIKTGRLSDALVAFATSDPRGREKP